MSIWFEKSRKFHIFPRFIYGDYHTGKRLDLYWFNNMVMFNITENSK